SSQTGCTNGESALAGHALSARRLNVISAAAVMTTARLRLSDSSSAKGRKNPAIAMNQVTPRHPSAMRRRYHGISWLRFSSQTIRNWQNSTYAQKITVASRIEARSRRWLRSRTPLGDTATAVNATARHVLNQCVPRIIGKIADQKCGSSDRTQSIEAKPAV